MRRLTVVICIIVLAAGATFDLVRADDPNGEPYKKADGISSRGAKDALLGWADIPKSVVDVTNESKNPLTGLTRGALKGIIKAFSKTVSGVASVLPSRKDDAKTPDQSKGEAR